MSVSASPRYRRQIGGCFREERPGNAWRYSRELIVNTAEAAVDAAKSGLGIVRVLSYQAEASLADGSLRRILTDFEPEPIPVNLIHREDRLPQAKVESFIAFAAPRLRQALKGSGE